MSIFTFDLVNRLKTLLKKCFFSLQTFQLGFETLRITFCSGALKISTDLVTLYSTCCLVKGMLKVLE